MHFPTQRLGLSCGCFYHTLSLLFWRLILVGLCWLQVCAEPHSLAHS